MLNLERSTSPRVMRMAVLAVLSLMVQVRPTHSIKDGVTASKCDYPGLAVVINSQDAILCTGLRMDSGVIMPLKCKLILDGAIANETLRVKSSGFLWTFNNDTIFQTDTRTDGTYRLSLENGQRSPDVTELTSCFSGFDFDANFALIFTEGFNGLLYDGSEPLDTSTCKVAGFGGSTNDGALYNEGNLKAASITKSLSATCCAAVSDTLSDTEKGIGIISESFNCVVSSGAPCGLADLGGPVMCKTNSGRTVTIGLVASSPCVSNGLFLIHDLTGKSPNTKFGVTPITA